MWVESNLVRFIRCKHKVPLLTSENSIEKFRMRREDLAEPQAREMRMLADISSVG